MRELKPGWYWVKFVGDYSAAEWRGDDYGWYVAGMEGSVPESCFDGIGPRIPTPDEPWQCVPVEPTTRQVAAGIEAYAGKCEESYKAMLAAAPSPDEVKP